MFEAIGVVALIIAAIIFLLGYAAIQAIAPIVWLIYGIIVVLLIVWNVYLFYTDDCEKYSQAATSAGIAFVLYFVAKIIAEIFS